MNVDLRQLHFSCVQCLSSHDLNWPQTRLMNTYVLTRLPLSSLAACFVLIRPVSLSPIRTPDNQLDFGDCH